MSEVTPLPALAGGPMIGLASALLLLGHGKIAGICGIFAGMIQPGAGDARGSGCTSGHGVCGIGRLSPRSMLLFALLERRQPSSGTGSTVQPDTA